MGKFLDDRSSELWNYLKKYHTVLLIDLVILIIVVGILLFVNNKITDKYVFSKLNSRLDPRIEKDINDLYFKLSNDAKNYYDFHIRSMENDLNKLNINDDKLLKKAESILEDTRTSVMNHIFKCERLEEKNDFIHKVLNEDDISNLERLINIELNKIKIDIFRTYSYEKPNTILILICIAASFFIVGIFKMLLYVLSETRLLKEVPLLHDHYSNNFSISVVSIMLLALEIVCILLIWYAKRY